MNEIKRGEILRKYECPDCGFVSSTDLEIESVWCGACWKKTDKLVAMKEIE